MSSVKWAGGPSQPNGQFIPFEAHTTTPHTCRRMPAMTSEGKQHNAVFSGLSGVRGATVLLDSGPMCARKVFLLVNPDSCSHPARPRSTCPGMPTTCCYMPLASAMRRFSVGTRLAPLTARSFPFFAATRATAPASRIKYCLLGAYCVEHAQSCCSHLYAHTIADFSYQLPQHFSLEGAVALVHQQSRPI